MKTIVVASKNPVKINAALQGFQLMFPHETFVAVGITVQSGVSDQPKDDAETLLGAMNRVNNIARLSTADYWVAIEGGVEMRGNEMAAFAWVVVRDASGRVGKAKTGMFFVPPRVAELVRQGVELGKADDMVFGEHNSKESSGASGLLTGDVIDRTALYAHATILALAPFRNPHLY